jgi:hypothetical protein
MLEEGEKKRRRTGEKRYRENRRIGERRARNWE